MFEYRIGSLLFQCDVALVTDNLNTRDKREETKG